MRPKFSYENCDGHSYVFYLMDCIPGIRQLKADSVDVVMTSPPYNLGTKYHVYDDSIGREKYLRWIREWGQEVQRVLHAQGSLFLNIGGKPSQPMVPIEVAETLHDLFQVQNVIHWVKSISIDRENVGSKLKLQQDISVGHYKPINSHRFVNDCHEYIFHLTKRGDVPLDRLAVGVEYQDKSNVRRWNGSGPGLDLRCRGNTWFVPYDTIQHRDSQRPHPAAFPPKIPEMCIRLHGVQRTGLVMDPFFGIGNTAVACVNLGVDFVGFEIDPEYAETADRLVSISLQATQSPPFDGNDLP